MSTAIVILNVSQTQAPQPGNQQKKGAFVSQGATTLAPNESRLLTSVNDLAAILTGALALTSVVWDAGIVTATATAPHGIPVGQIVDLTITGVEPAGYNGSFQCTSTGASTFTYPLVANPGAQTVAGVYTPEDVAELVAMNTTFWSQGSQQPAYVLELGIGDAAQGVAALAAHINTQTVNNVGPFYRYLFPRQWADEPTLPAFISTFSNSSAKTYFHITANNENYVNFTNLMKAAIVFIEAPGIPATEFTAAAMFWVTLNYNPSAGNKLTPTRYAFLFGVTPYPLPGNQAIINTYLAANVNLALTGAEGGLSNVVLRNGQTMDGRDVTYWYSVDWVSLNLDRNLSNAIINGSNNPLNPLYYNADGINRLQATIANTMAQAVSFGLVLGAPLQLQLEPSDFINNLDNGVYAGLSPINAQQFIPYSIANPNDFAAGIYNGFQVAFTPNRGFTTITINLNVTDFVAG